MQYVFFKNNKAFTLLELLIVISIVGIITAASVVPYNNFVKRSRDTRRKVDIEQLRAALELYKSNSDVGLYPAALGNLAPNYIKAVPTDPQNKVYSYVCSPVDCTDYQISIMLESGSVYIAQSGSATSVLPTSSTGGTRPTPTSIQPTTVIQPTVIACTKKQNGESCSFDADCCSRFCNTGASNEQQVLGISYSRGTKTIIAANTIDPPPTTGGICSNIVNEIPRATSTPIPSPTAIQPTTVRCPLGGTYTCGSLGCRCERTVCVNNSCVNSIGDGQSTCILGTSCGNYSY